MTSSRGSRFRLDEHGLQASALRAQVLERCRRTLHHDMNNAVQSIHSGLELLSKSIGSPGVVRISPQDCVALLQQQFVTLRQTLNRLVDDIAEPPGDPETFDLSALTSEALQLLRHERAASSARTNLEPGITVQARKVNVRTAVMALLLDAIDHLPGARVLEVSVAHRGGQAVLEISGARQQPSGEEPSALGYVLERLLADETAELEVQQANDSVTQRIRLPSPPQEQSTPRAKSGPVRVLIADRNRDAADSLAMILQLEGMQAQTLYRCDQLRDVLMTFSPDVALIDVDLPGCNLSEIARIARDQGDSRPLLAQVSSTDRAKHDGFDAQLLRPVEWPQLQTLIERARRNV